MLENPAFQQWTTVSYEGRYRSPPRHGRGLTTEEARGHGFEFVRREDYENEVRFTPEQLAAYLTTQSNIIAAAEQGRESIEEVYSWLMQQITPLFPVESATFYFDGYIWYLQKISA